MVLNRTAFAISCSSASFLPEVVIVRGARPDPIFAFPRLSPEPCKVPGCPGASSAFLLGYSLWSSSGSLCRASLTSVSSGLWRRYPSASAGRVTSSGWGSRSRASNSCRSVRMSFWSSKSPTALFYRRLSQKEARALRAASTDLASPWYFQAGEEDGSSIPLIVAATLSVIALRL